MLLSQYGDGSRPVGPGGMNVHKSQLLVASVWEATGFLNWSSPSMDDRHRQEQHGNQAEKHLGSLCQPSLSSKRPTAMRYVRMNEV